MYTKLQQILYQYYNPYICLTQNTHDAYKSILLFQISNTLQFNCIYLSHGIYYLIISHSISSYLHVFTCMLLSNKKATCILTTLHDTK